MPIKPEADESQSDWMERCVSEMMDAGDSEQDQAVAACSTMWRDRNKKKLKAVSPEEDETREDFMERCIGEGGDEEECALAWDEAGGEDEEKRAGGVVRKTHLSSETSGLEFVLSDATPDRMGDVIVSDGWDLTNFKKNPVALFNHNSNFPIGKWKNLRVHNGSLRGHLDLAKKGTSQRIDEIISLVEQGILRAVSVGFLTTKSEPLKKSGGSVSIGTPGGLRYLGQELVETSLVAIPANPNSLAVAKSLKISAPTVAMVFAGKGNRDQSVVRRSVNGGHAETTRGRKDGTMSPLTKRIEATQQRLVALRDELQAHLDGVDDENPVASDVTTTEEFNKRIEDQEAMLKSLQTSEARLAKNAAADDDPGDLSPRPTVVRTNGSRRPFNYKPKELAPLEFLVRAGTVRAMSKSPDFVGQSLDQIRQRIYGDDEATRVICDLTLKAASAPAMTTVTGWAKELVQEIVEGLMPQLMPSAVYPTLSGMGLRLTFGRNGRIVVPTRSATPTVAGSFVGEGAPIPVRQAAFTSTPLTPKKMAVITTWTREMDEHSVPAIEGLLREAIQQDTAVAIDTILLDATAASAIRPAGIRNGVSGLTPTAGGGFTALVGDLKQLTGTILTATNGNIRNMVFIMNPQQGLSIGYIQPPNPTGLFPFAADINNNRLAGYPVIKSGTVPLGMVICMDAADYVSVTSDTPRFEISDQATLHMEDTSPQHIGTAGTPGTVATPAQSMFQTDSLALRLILPMNWAIRRSGTVSWVTGVTW
jgi:HK97 family phage prohead protease